MDEKNVTELLREDRHDFRSLVEIMRILRSENGCPWDREQNHQSIRANFIEETYEVVEAIDKQDASLMREELGDVLLQVIFHARIAEEEGQFCMDDVIHDICAKLIHRHPHIFENVQADTSDVVLENWEKIKKEEKQRVGLSGTLHSIPPSLPSLMRAQKIVKKCTKEELAPDIHAAAVQMSHAASDIAENGADCDKEELRKKLSRVLLSAAVVAQQNGLDTEEILYDACRHITDTITEAEQMTSDGLTALSEVERKSLSGRAFFSE